MRILAIGDINVDIILRSGPPHKGKQVVINDYDVYGGGCATNFSYACAKLGAKVKLIGRVGGDYWGNHVIQELDGAGVDVCDVNLVKSGKTGVTFALVENLERSFISFRGENARFSAKDMQKEFRGFDLVHIPSFFLLESLQQDYAGLMRKAKEDGALVSFDTGWDPFGRWSGNKALPPALKMADFFLPNLDEARKILGKPKASESEAANGFLRTGLKAVAIKNGARGSFVADGKNSAKIPAFKVGVVDTTGAGDVFNAAFMVSYLSGNDVVVAGRFANAAAALSVTGAGWAKYPKLADVNALLRSSGFEPVRF